MLPPTVGVHVDDTPSVVDKWGVLPARRPKKVKRFQAGNATDNNKDIKKKIVAPHGITKFGVCLQGTSDVEDDDVALPSVVKAASAAPSRHTVSQKKAAARPTEESGANVPVKVARKKAKPDASRKRAAESAPAPPPPPKMSRSGRTVTQVSRFEAKPASGRMISDGAASSKPASGNKEVARPRSNPPTPRAVPRDTLSTQLGGQSTAARPRSKPPAPRDAPRDTLSQSTASPLRLLLKKNRLSAKISVQAMKSQPTTPYSPAASKAARAGGKAGKAVSAVDMNTRIVSMKNKVAPTGDVRAPLKKRPLSPEKAGSTTYDIIGRRMVKGKPVYLTSQGGKATGWKDESLVDMGVVAAYIAAGTRRVLDRSAPLSGSTYSVDKITDGPRQNPAGNTEYMVGLPLPPFPPQPYRPVSRACRTEVDPTAPCNNY